VQYLPVVLLLSSQVIGCLYAAVRGGSPERWGAGLYLVNWVLSNLAAYLSRRDFLTTETGLMAVDAAYLIVMVALALKAQRFWPLWAAALQLDTVLTHILMFSKATPPFSYGFALWLWGLPIPVLIGIGAWRHRQRVKQWGSDPAWT
jgi:hypothetical protein